MKEKDTTRSQPSSRAEILSVAEGLGASIIKFSDETSDASKASLEATRGTLTGTELADEWPLVGKYGLRNRLIAGAELRLREEMTTIPNSAATAGGLESRRYYDSMLAEAYHGENPRMNFVSDLIGWANAMADRGRSTLVHIDLSDPGRVGVSVYEDVAAVRDHLREITDSSYLITEEEVVTEGYTPSVWASGRVVVGGDSEFVSHLIATQ